MNALSARPRGCYHCRVRKRHRELEYLVEGCTAGTGRAEMLQSAFQQTLCLPTSHFLQIPQQPRTQVDHPLYSQEGGSSERGMTWPRSHSWLVAELGLCASFLLSGHVTKRAPCLESHRGQA